MVLIPQFEVFVNPLETDQNPLIVAKTSRDSLVLVSGFKPFCERFIARKAYFLMSSRI